MGYVYFMVENIFQTEIPETPKINAPAVIINGVRYFSVRSATKEIKSKSLSQIQKMIVKGRFYTVTINDAIFVPEYAIKIWQADEKGILDVFLVEKNGETYVAWNENEILKFVPKGDEKIMVSCSKITADNLFTFFSTKREEKQLFFLYHNALLHIKSHGALIGQKNFWYAYIKTHNKKLDAYIKEKSAIELQKTFKEDLESSLIFLEKNRISLE